MPSRMRPIRIQNRRQGIREMKFDGVGARLIAPALLAVGLTLTCGGCPDVRNGLVDAAERAAESAATSGLGNDPAEVLQDGITTTILNIVFDRLRNPQP